MNPAPPSVVPPQSSLSELENEVIAFFVDTVRWFGAPKSLGAIYGLLFISDEPISFERIANRLQMSSGSVSQGLKLLKGLGVVKTVYLPGERRDFFVAETQLRQLVSNFLKQRVERQLISGEGRLSEVLGRAVRHDVAGGFPPNLRERLELLRRWQSEAKVTLPSVLRMLEG